MSHHYILVNESEVAQLRAVLLEPEPESGLAYVADLEERLHAASRDIAKLSADNDALRSEIRRLRTPTLPAPIPART